MISRRNFLGATSVAAAGFLLQSQQSVQAQEQDAARTFPSELYKARITGAPTDEICAAWKTAGFEGMEVTNWNIPAIPGKNKAIGTMKRFCTASLLMVLMLGCASQNHNVEGVRYYGQARYDAAITAFQSALQANPNDPNALYNIAATYHQSARASLRSGHTAAAQQQYEQAAQYYQLCLTKDPNYADAYRGLAALYMDYQNGEAAYQLLRNWYDANPVSVEPKLEFARFYQEFAQISMTQGRTEDAQRYRDATERLLQQVLTAESTNYRALRALGFLKEQSGDVAGAVAEYQRSLQVHPQQQDLVARVAALTR